MPQPPAALRWIAGRLLPASQRELVLADLDEDYGRRPRRAAPWYLAQAIHVALTRPWRVRDRFTQTESRHLMWSTIWQDVRYGLRTLRKAPGFTAVAVLSLAIGIGLNSTIFAMVDNLLFRPLPYANPDRIVAVYTSDGRGERFGSSSYPDLRDLAAGSSTLEALVGHSMMFAAVSIEGDNRLAFGEVVTANYFRTLGIPLAMGAGFEPSHEQGEGASPVVIISDRLWARSFGRARDIIGRTLKVKSRPYTIVGVTTRAFTGSIPGVEADLWIPVTMVDDVEPAGQLDSVPSATGTTRLTQRGNRWLFLKGRLRDGATIDAARADLDTLMQGLAATHPISNRNRSSHVLPAEQVRFHPDIDQVMRPAGAVLAGAVGLVLLIACANLANMLLARGAARTREMALRSAIGASRVRLVRQMAVESLVLSLAGGAAGLMLAVWATSWIVNARLPIELPIVFTMPIDWRLVAFTGGLAVFTGLAFGLLPALKASRPDLVASLKDDASLASPGRRFSVRHALVVTQVAVSVVLLVGGLLLVRSLFAGFNANPGFEVSGLVTSTVSMDMHGYDDARSKRFFEDAVRRVGLLPGVTSVALAERLPFSPNNHTTTLVIDGRPEATPATGASVSTTRVSANYFETLGVPLLAGRAFDSRDTPESTRVAIVSETFVKTFYPNGDALGHRVRLRDQSGPIVEIIGISRDYATLSVGERPRPVIHFAASQRPANAYSVLARTSGDSTALTQGIERELRALEPEVVFLELGTLARMAATSMLPISLGAAIFGGLASLAMLLAGVGLYGVIAFSVARRTREIGIRMALGSTTGRVISGVLREALTMVGVGTVIGVVLAAVGAQVLSSVLLGVSALDPLSFLGAVALLAVVAGVAAIVPARRAAAVDPLTALRTL